MLRFWLGIIDITYMYVDGKLKLDHDPMETVIFYRTFYQVFSRQNKRKKYRHFLTFLRRESVLMPNSFDLTISSLHLRFARITQKLQIEEAVYVYWLNYETFLQMQSDKNWI